MKTLSWLCCLLCCCRLQDWLSLSKWKVQVAIGNYCGDGLFCLRNSDSTGGKLGHYFIPYLFFHNTHTLMLLDTPYQFTYLLSSSEHIALCIPSLLCIIFMFGWSPCQQPDMTLMEPHEIMWIWYGTVIYLCWIIFFFWVWVESEFQNYFKHDPVNLSCNMYSIFTVYDLPFRVVSMPAARCDLNGIWSSELFQPWDILSDCFSWELLIISKTSTVVQLKFGNVWFHPIFSTAHGLLIHLLRIEVSRVSEKRHLVCNGSWRPLLVWHARATSAGVSCVSTKQQCMAVRQ